MRQPVPSQTAINRHGGGRVNRIFIAPRITAVIFDSILLTRGRGIVTKRGLISRGVEGDEEDGGRGGGLKIFYERINIGESD